ncbi:MAG: metal-dependent transcriptional regulator [Acidobacteriota bacterium]
MPVKEDKASSQSLSQAIEDYLKAIYTLAGDQKAASTSAIAKRLKVSSAAVTAMLKRMSEAGLVRYQRRRGVMLTKVGTALALETIRRHRLLESFFTDHLAMDWHQAHVEAETLEHFISRELEKLIDSKLGHPLSDPHGHPIPSAKGVVSKEALKPLTDLAAGTSAVVRRVSDEDAEHMRWWKKIGLVPGCPIRVREVGPFEGPLLLEIRGKSHHVGRKAVEGIWVGSDGKRRKAVKPRKAAAKAGKR